MEKRITGILNELTLPTYYVIALIHISFSYKPVLALSLLAPFSLFDEALEVAFLSFFPGAAFLAKLFLFLVLLLSSWCSFHANSSSLIVCFSSSTRCLLSIDKTICFIQQINIFLPKVSEEIGGHDIPSPLWWCCCQHHEFKLRRCEPNIHLIYFRTIRWLQW